MTTLQATCLDDDNKMWTTSLNLNLCLGNEAGRLVWQDNGNFDSTCRPCIVDQLDSGPAKNSGLKCNCLPTPNGVPKLTQIELYPEDSSPLAVKLVDGRFVCGSHEGTKVAN